MLQLRAGDCDDMAIVLGAMLEAVGHSVRLVLTGTDPLAPDRFTHIYIEVLCRGRWVPLDATMPYPMGWAPRAPVRKVIAIARSAEARSPAALHGIRRAPSNRWRATSRRARTWTKASASIERSIAFGPHA